ncbi:WAT1-related protein [Quillaja saponaria]|uniref:WAT1-related protein n=1 Tax=Quillaja saponaria TaxID=32244 RepID=A0AAD7QDI9_QUISA|nr:WAT1-related protein [Quillaja saponaria]
MKLGALDDYKPEMAMFGLQFAYAGVALITKAALLQGLSPRVFVVYRQAIATLVMAPIAYFSRRKSSTCFLGLRSFVLIFMASLIGITINQNFFFEGMYLSSSSMASAMGNLTPAVTFVIATFFGMEKVNIRSLRSWAKILGTVFCVVGAVSMALLKGPKLLNVEIMPAKSVFDAGENSWFLGCLFLFGSCICWSIWLILQVPGSASHPDPLSLSAWMCFFATLQSAAVTVFFERDIEAWRLHSVVELSTFLFSGVIGSGFAFFAQAWCISQRGPLFSAMFNPLATVIVTILAALFLHEEIYSGSLLGAVGVIIGLYVVLWGKAEDFIEIVDDTNPKLQDHKRQDHVKILIDETSEKTCCKIDLGEPLLLNKSPQ